MAKLEHFVRPCSSFISYVGSNAPSECNMRCAVSAVTYRGLSFCSGGGGKKCWKCFVRQINQLESVLQTDEAKEVLGAALLTTDVEGEGEVDDNDAMIDGVLALNTADTSFQSVRDEFEEDAGGGNASEEELEPGRDP